MAVLLLVWTEVKLGFSAGDILPSVFWSPILAVAVENVTTSEVCLALLWSEGILSLGHSGFLASPSFFACIHVCNVKVVLLQTLSHGALQWLVTIP